jgi:hypothetical protein
MVSNFDIPMTRAGPDSRKIVLTVQAEASTMKQNWANVNGTVTYNRTPLCAMILANGQHMFSCGDSDGIYELEVPLDSNGAITLYGFSSGFLPYKDILMPNG